MVVPREVSFEEQFEALAEEERINQYLQVVNNVFANSGENAETVFHQTIEQKGHHPVLTKAFYDLIPQTDLKK